MSKKAPEPGEYAVTLEEFLGELSKANVEQKAGFRTACRESKITGHKERAEWSALLEKYNKLPAGEALTDKEDSRNG